MINNMILTKDNLAKWSSKGKKVCWFVGIIFFWKWGIEYGPLLIYCLIALFSENALQLIDHIRLKHVSTNKKYKKKDNLDNKSIWKSRVRSPDALVIQIPCYRLQSVAPWIHNMTILCLLEIRPHTGPVRSQGDNLQKGWSSWFVKNKITSNIP